MRRGRAADEGPAELPAGSDAELWVHLAQVPLDRAWADEQLGADLGVRTPFTSKSGYLGLLAGQLVESLDVPFAYGLARSQQLAASALAEPLGTYTSEHVVGRTQLHTRVDATAGTAKPFAIDKMRTGELDPNESPGQPFDS